MFEARFLYKCVSFEDVCRQFLYMTNMTESLDKEGTRLRQCKCRLSFVGRLKSVWPRLDVLQKRRAALEGKPQRGRAQGSWTALATLSYTMYQDIP